MNSKVHTGFRTALAAIALAAGGFALACVNNPWFPTVEGATWTYSSSGDTFTQSISGVTPTTFTMTIDTADGSVDIEYICREDGSILVDMNSTMASMGAAEDLAEAGVEFELVFLDGVTFPTDFSVGATWESVSVAEATMNMEGITGTMTNTITSVGRVDRHETVTVPAGTFTAAVVVSDVSVEMVTLMMGMSIPFNYEVTSVAWLVEGVGMVRGEDDTGVTELVSYVIP